MALILLADGSHYSSIVTDWGGTGLNLGDPAPEPRRFRDNSEAIEGDAGIGVEYVKGANRRLLNVHLPLVSNQVRAAVNLFFEIMKGRGNWFTVQLSHAPDLHYASTFTQEGTASQTEIRSEDAFGLSVSENLVGAYIYALNGLNVGLRRKIIREDPSRIEVTVEAFPFNVSMGDNLRLGLPARFDSDLEFIPRLPQRWDANFALIERLPNE